MAASSVFKLTVRWTLFFGCILAFQGHPMSTTAKIIQKKELLRAGSVTRRIFKSPGVGGQGGADFDDRITPPMADLVTIDGVRNISISCGTYLESMQVTYLLSNHSYFQAPRRGKLLNSEIKITLASDEFLMKVEGFHNGIIIQQVSFTTQLFNDQNKTYTHTYGPYGNIGNTPFSVEGYVVGFHGRFGDQLINIGVYALASLSKSGEMGGGENSQLTHFDDRPDEMVAPVSRISVLYINHGDGVDAIQTEYTLLGGVVRRSDKHGGPGGNMTPIVLARDEAMIGIEGTT